MDAQNYVAPDPNNPGSYITVINGAVTGSGITQNQAENLYNGMGGPVSAPSGASYTAQPAVTSGGIPSGGAQTQYAGYQSYQDMYNKLVSLGWRTPTTDPNGILSAYNGAHGGGGTPAGGMTLAGGLDQATLASSTAQQAAQQQYLRDRLNLLEIPMSQNERQQALAKLALDYAAMTGYYAPARGTTAGTQMTDQQALDAIAGSRDNGFWDFYRSNGWGVDSPDQKRAAVSNWITSADPRWTGMSAVQVAQQLGLAPAGASSAGLGGVAAGAAGATPTFAREQFNAANWQNVANMLASKSGPRDWATYQQLQPKVAFGAMTGTPSWEQAFSQWFGGGKEPGSVAFPQPNTMRPQDWQAMSPTQQEMAVGAVQYNGVDAQDWFKNMQAGWPTGKAPATTSWR